MMRGPMNKASASGAKMKTHISGFWSNAGPVTLTTPLVAIGHVAIVRFHVEDYLDDHLKPTTADKS